MNAQHDTSRFATIQAIYEAFGRGDAPAILEHVSPEVTWEYGFGPHDVPWLQPRAGREGVAAFLEAVATGLRITRFVPKEMLAGADKVVVLLDIEAEGVRSGLALREEDEVHIWHFDAEGRVCRFRHVADTLQHQRVARG